MIFTIQIEADSLQEALALLHAKTGPAQVPENPTAPPTAPAVAPPTVPQAPPAAVVPAAASAPLAPTPPATTPPPATAVGSAPPVVPTAAAPTYDRDQIMAAGAALIDAGKINELMGLLGAFGVQAVTHLKPEQLGAFATELRKLGAQI